MANCGGMHLSSLNLSSLPSWCHFSRKYTRQSFFSVSYVDSSMALRRRRRDEGSVGGQRISGCRTPPEERSMSKMSRSDNWALRVSISWGRGALQGNPSGERSKSDTRSVSRDSDISCCNVQKQWYFKEKTYHVHTATMTARSSRGLLTRHNHLTVGARDKTLKLFCRNEPSTTVIIEGIE
jgi:hypothetical protein